MGSHRSNRQLEFRMVDSGRAFQRQTTNSRKSCPHKDWVDLKERRVKCILCRGQSTQQKPEGGEETMDIKIMRALNSAIRVQNYGLMSRKAAEINIQALYFILKHLE